jgi:hypothetical protein
MKTMTQFCIVPVPVNLTPAPKTRKEITEKRKRNRKRT